MKRTIAIIILCALVVMNLCGCEKRTTNENLWVGETTQFETVEYGNDFRIIRHKETGVCYLFWESYQQAGLTVMLNTDGTPYMWTGTEPPKEEAE